MERADVANHAKALSTPTVSPFDEVAGIYDQGFGRSPATRLFRCRLIDRIVKVATPGATLLDLGSGTGEDAVWLASLGFVVTGIDASPGMVDVARAKSGRARSRAVFHLADFKTFDPVARFDAVYANFGAMNCIPLEAWRDRLERLVRPGGSVLFVLMGSRPLPEGLRHGRAAWSLRLEGEASVGGGRTIRAHYPSPTRIQGALRPGFEIRRTETLGLLVPPPGSSDWPRRNPMLFGLLAALEMAVSRRRVLCSFADHFLVELVRR